MPILRTDLRVLTDPSATVPVLLHHFRTREFSRREIARLKPFVAKFRYTHVDLDAFTSVFPKNSNDDDNFNTRPTASSL